MKENQRKKTLKKKSNGIWHFGYIVMWSFFKTWLVFVLKQLEFKNKQLSFSS